MEKTFEQELKTILTDLVGDKKAREEAEVAREARLKTIETLTTEQKAKLEKIESTVVKMDLGPKGYPSVEVYKGFQMANQFGQYNSKFSFVKDADRERMAKFWIDAYSEAMKSPGKNILLKDMTEGSSTAGGNAVFTENHANLLAFATLSSVALRECTIIPMGSKDAKWPRESAFGTGSWENEATDFDQAEPTIDQVTLTAVRRGSFAKVTNELLADASFDIAAYLTVKNTEDMGQAIDARVFGTNASYGLSGAAITQEITADGTAFVSADLLDKMNSELPPNKKLGAKYFLHRKILHEVKTIKASTSGVYVYAAPNGTVPASIWGFPYVEVEVMEDSMLSTDNVIVIFGNLKNYYVGMRKDMSILVDPFTFGKSDQTQFIFSSRWAVAISQPSAFIKLVIP